MILLSYLFFAVVTLAQTPAKIHCWVNTAQGDSRSGAIESNEDKVSFSLVKSIDASKADKVSLLNGDSKYSYSVSIEKDAVAFMSVQDEKSGFSAISAPRRALSDQDSIVLTLRKKLSKNKFKIAELNCAKESFFSKLKEASK